MDFPKEITDKTIQSHLFAGSVIRMNTTFPDGAAAYKRLIILTNDNANSILAVTTTSNPKSPRRYYGQDDIFIPAGAEKSFESDT